MTFIVPARIRQKSYLALKINLKNSKQKITWKLTQYTPKDLINPKYDKLFENNEKTPHQNLHVAK